MSRGTKGRELLKTTGDSEPRSRRDRTGQPGAGAALVWSRVGSGSAPSVDVPVGARLSVWWFSPVPAPAHRRHLRRSAAPFRYDGRRRIACRGTRHQGRIRQSVLVAVAAGSEASAGGRGAVRSSGDGGAGAFAEPFARHR